MSDDYRMRKCGDGWEYCNGKCSECPKMHIITTNHTYRTQEEETTWNALIANIGNSCKAMEKIYALQQRMTMGCVMLFHPLAKLQNGVQWLKVANEL